MFNNLFNDPIIKQLSEAYLDILSEDHTQEQIDKLSVEELKALVSEYKDKVEMAKDEEEANKNKQELQMILDELKSREDNEEKSEE